MPNLNFLSPTAIKAIELMKKLAPITWMCTSNYERIIKAEHPELDPMDIETLVLVQEQLDANC